MYGLDNLLKFAVSANKSVRSQSKEDIVLNKFSRTTRTAAVAAIAGLSLSLSVPVVAQSLETAPKSIVDSSRQGSLNIHKKADPSQTGEPSGKEDTSVSGTSLANVGFTLFKIKGIDLTTNEGILKAKDIKASDYLQAGVVDVNRVDKIGTEKTTGTDGNVTFSNLALGAYLVVETAPLPGYTPAAPFIAFVPMTQDNKTTGGVEWNYDVHAYPKNYKANEPTKKVEDSGKNVGDTIRYTIEAFAQPLGESQNRTVFRIEDQLDERLTASQADEVIVEVEGVDDLSRETDYTVVVDGQKVKIEFTDSGLGKLKNNAKVTVKIPTLVKHSGDGDVLNAAQVYENDPNTGQEKEPKNTPTVHTYYGGITFTKVSAKDGSALQGAEFKVFGATENQTCSEAVTKADQVQRINNVDTWVSSEEESSKGTVIIEGLHVNDKADDNPKAEPNTTKNKFVKYCLVETKSPVGFELLPQPIEFEITQAQKGQTIEIGTAGKIENLEDTTPNLPMTGGAGIGILAALGALIIGAGAWLARRNSAKN